MEAFWTVVSGKGSLVRSLQNLSVKVICQRSVSPRKGSNLAFLPSMFQGIGK